MILGGIRIEHIAHGSHCFEVSNFGLRPVPIKAVRVLSIAPKRFPRLHLTKPTAGGNFLARGAFCVSREKLFVISSFRYCV